MNRQNAPSTGRRRSLPLRVEHLEGRALLANLIVTNTNDSGPGSLRQMILDSNADPNPGAHVLYFKIPGAGVHTIMPTSQLPNVTAPISFGGSTEPGFVQGGDPLIEIDGEHAGSGANGLVIDSNASVQHLAINRFAGNGVVFEAGSRGGVIDCRIGTDPTGTVAEGNGGDGIRIGTGLGVGTGPSSADRNVISGNGGWGIHADFSGPNLSVLLYDYIGTDITGTRALPNGAGGIDSEGSNVGIYHELVSGNHGDGVRVVSGYKVTAEIQYSNIGTDPSGTIAIPNQGDGIRSLGLYGAFITDDVISANTGDGIDSETDVTYIKTCKIGSDVSGTKPLGNGLHGIRVASNNNWIGGSGTEGNVIAFNGTLTPSAGIAVLDPFVGTNIQNDNIFGNSGLGIDLGDDGPTPNHPGGGTSGPDNGSNYPILTSAVSTATTTTISGSLDTQYPVICRVDFYASDTPDPSGYGQGQFYLGSTGFPNAPNGPTTFTVTLPVGLQGGEFLSAVTFVGTYITTVGSSEFSPTIPATGTPKPSADLSVAINAPAGTTPFGSNVTFAVNVTNNGPSPASGVTLLDTLPPGTSFVSATSGQGTASMANGVVTALLGALTVGQTVEVRITVRPATSGTISDTATVSGVLIDRVPANNRASMNAVVVPSAALTVTLTPSTTRPFIGGDLAYTAVVTNLGPSTATGVVFTDQLPSGVTLGPYSSSQGTINPTSTVGLLRATIGTLAPGASATVVIHVWPNARGTIVDSVTVSEDQAGPPPSLPTVTLPVVKPLLENDFDGDGKADLAVFGKDLTTGRYRFKVATSSSGFNPNQPLIFDNNGYGFGNAFSIPVAADYFGEGRAAFGLFTPDFRGGMQFTAVSTLTGKFVTVTFGSTTDTPVVADVDGDGKADFGVYGFQQGLGYRFAFLLSSTGFAASRPYIFNNGAGYGNAQSIPVVADFDGGGRAGFGLYNPSSAGSNFAYVAPWSNVSIVRTVGAPGDMPSAVDYDGDGKADLSLYGKDPATGRYRFLILTSSSVFNVKQEVVFNNNGYGFGNPTSIPAMGDYQGTGKVLPALFTSDFAGGMEYVFQPPSGPGMVVDFATLTDIPLSVPSYLRARLVRGIKG